MKSKKTNTLFGILLTMTLVFQLSFHVIHVFTSHGSDSHVTLSNDTNQFGEASYSCDLCAKLLSNGLYLLLFLLPLLSPIVLLPTIETKEQFYPAKLKGDNPLRGPPFLLFSV